MYTAVIIQGASQELLFQNKLDEATKLKQMMTT